MTQKVKTDKSEEKIEQVLQKGYRQIADHITLKELSQIIFDHLKLVPGDKTKVVSFIGGAASGKTSIVKSIVSDSTKRNLNAGSFSTDDFLVGDRAYRREHFEGKAPLSKYDFDFMNTKIRAIKDNVDQDIQIGIPIYDGKTGKAIAYGEESYPNQIGPVELLIVEGDFDMVDDDDLKIYFHVPDRIRLQNRLNRDRQSRDDKTNSQVEENFMLRQTTQHELYTLPTAEKAQMIIVADLKEGEEEYRFGVYTRISK